MSVVLIAKYTTMIYPNDHK